MWGLRAMVGVVGIGSFLAWFEVREIFRKGWEILVIFFGFEE